MAVGRALRDRERLAGDGGSSEPPPAGASPPLSAADQPLGGGAASSAPSAADAVSMLVSAATSEVGSTWEPETRTPSATAESFIEVEQPRRPRRNAVLPRLRHEDEKHFDQIDCWMLKEELNSAKQALARLKADSELVAKLDLPGLASLRAEIIATHMEALERIDDRRVVLHARQAALREGPESGRCVACWARKADRLMLPCRHLCVCGTCLASCSSVCPICRANVVDSLEVFGAS